MSEKKHALNGIKMTVSRRVLMSCILLLGIVTVRFLPSIAQQPDTTPPTVQLQVVNRNVQGIVQPNTAIHVLPRSPYNGTVALRALPTDNVGVTKVEYYFDGQYLGTGSLGAGFIGGYDYYYVLNVNLSNVVNGRHTITAKAYDQANNFAVSTYSYYTLKDSTPAVINATLPAAGAVVSGSVPLSATANDPESGVKYIYFSLSTYGGIDNPCWTSSCAKTWDTTAYPDGIYTLKAVTANGIYLLSEVSRQVEINNSGTSTTNKSNTTTNKGKKK